MSNTIYRALLFVPVLTFAWAFLALVTFTVDLPFYDDWRDFISGDYASFDPAYLFRPTNDTIYAGGRVLDAIAMRVLSGNVAVYQAISFITVMGGILVVQGALLMRTTRSFPITATASVALVFILQPGTYWGSQFIAYHQIVPLLYLLLACLLVLRAVSTWRSVGLVALTLGGGLTYVSGGIGFLAFAIGLMAYHFFFVRGAGPSGAVPGGRRALTAAWAVLPPALLTTSMQAWVVAVVQSGIHVPGASFALPTDASFWGFSAGLLARAVGASPNIGGLVGAIVAWGLGALSLIAIGLRIRRTHTLTNGSADNIPSRNVERELLLVVVPLGVAIGAYVAIVAAGRATVTVPEGGAFMDFYRAAFGRFHFTWVAALSPWLIAVWLVALLGWSVRRGTLQAVSGLIVVAVLGTSIEQDLFEHRAYFARQGDGRARDIRCINTALERGAKTIECPSAYPFQGLRRAVAVARRDGLTWARHFTAGGSGPGSMVHSYRGVFDLGDDNARAALTLSDGGLSALDAADGFIATIEIADALDPQLLIDPAPGSLEGCTRVIVTMTLRADEPDIAQVYFSTRTQPGFEEIRSLRGAVGGGIKTLHFTIAPPDPITDPIVGPLRLDPISITQPATVDKISIGCLET